MVFTFMVALATGILIAFQSSWNGAAGKQIGAFNASLLSLVAGGLVSATILVFKRGVDSAGFSSSFWQVVGMGVSGILIGASISFLVQRMGVTAAMGLIALGQYTVSFLIDALGWGGTTVPVEARRVLGLATLAIAIYLLSLRS